jgi:thiamine biosynthesis protein ThiI
MALLMVRYGEIALKSPAVRRRFERALGNNIAARFAESGRECRIEHERGRIFLWSNDADFAGKVLSRTFGVVSYSEVVESTSSREDIFRTAIALSKPFFRKSVRFCIRARRNGQHEYSSMELARDAGSAVFVANETLEPKVDLTNPELEIFVDVRQNKSYIYTGSVQCTGGMPLGTQGRMLGIVNNKNDIAACWLIMKRGCRVTVLTDDEELAQPLRRWDPNLKLLSLSGWDISSLARNRRADGLCLGWGVEEFDNQSPTMAGINIPLFYPLIGMSQAEIDGLMARITA